MGKLKSNSHRNTQIEQTEILEHITISSQFNEGLQNKQQPYRGFVHVTTKSTLWTDQSPGQKEHLK
jgi:hypothetical protein